MDIADTYREIELGGGEMSRSLYARLVYDF